MNRRIAALAAALLGASLPAAAQAPADNVAAWLVWTEGATPAEAAAALEANVRGLETACTADREGTACALMIVAVTPFVTTALATIGETRDRAAYAEGVRRYLQSPLPEVRSAAAFALARLFPDATDTPLLLPLLQEPIGGVRIAALAALRESSDPIARILANRTVTVENTDFVPDPLPYDPAALGVALPADAAYVAFERDEIENGTLVFTTAATPAEIITAIETAGAGERFDLRTVPQWLRTAGVPLFASGQGFADVTGLVLSGRADGGADQPIRIALIYRDTILNRTGVALTWWPAADTPLAPPAPPPANEQVARQAAPPELVIKPEAAPEDTAFYLDVMLAEGLGADRYLEAFPAGAYRAEFEALLATTLLVELADYRVRPGAPVTISFRNMPGNQRDWFAIMPPDAPLRDYEDYVTTAGARDGTVTLTAPVTPGEYEVRVFFNNTYVLQQRIPIIVDAAAPIPGPTTAGATVPGGPPPATVTGDTLALVGEPTAEAPIVVRYTGLPGSTGAWMTIVPAGTPDGTWADWAYTTGTTGEVTLPGQPAGAYELRAFVETPRRAIVARLPVTVGAGGAVAAVEPVLLEIVGRATAGQPIVVRFANVPDRPNNWVTIVGEGTADAIWGAYVYTAGGTAGEVTLPAQPAGRYEIRFLVETPRRDIVGRVAVTVE